MKAVDGEIAQILRSAGCKATQPRVYILLLLSKTKKPLTVQEIGEKLPKNIADQATVYRTVQLLGKIGLVQEVLFAGHDHAHYEYARRTDHHHIVCRSCDAVEDFVGCEVKTIQRQALAQSKQFKSIISHAIELSGYCKKCSV